MSEEVAGVLRRLGLGEARAVGSGLELRKGSGAAFSKCSPIDGSQLVQLQLADAQDAEAVGSVAERAFHLWRSVPAPQRGQAVRLLAEKLRAHKEDLALLVTLEVGKTRQEALGEVQEMVDICEFAVGLSRQLYGLNIASERPEHRLAEQWHPLGPIGVISAFNFPVAVWAWNTALALVCGNAVVWKPSEKAPLCALGCHQLAAQALAEAGAPEGLLGLLIGGADVGHALSSSRRYPLVSATGSVAMGRTVAVQVAERLGRCLLELGGNNAAVVAPSADLELALRGVVFGAAGTAGQRCTTTRRLIVHESLFEGFVERVEQAFERLPVGDPRKPDVALGPLIDERAFEAMQQALAAAHKQGGAVRGGERLCDGVPSGGHYVRPALVRIDARAAIVAEETFAPILYASPYADFDQAIAMQNAVRQGLSSALFTRDAREAERFCSALGSDCGIANVNVGTSGAEIGGAFGGEKDTGGGRESGSDAWKAYMRRATNTVNYSSQLPLAQGIVFDF